MSSGGGGGLLPPVVVRMLGDITQLRATMREARAQVDGTAAGMKAAGATAFAGMARMGKSVSLIGAGVAVASMKMAGDFEAQTMVLHTAAGETLSGLKTVRTGILDIAKGTGTDWHNLTEGMYQVEKAGIRGADGLKVLKAAAQGAREENASLESVTNAMTSVMASYHLKAKDSVQVMNAMKTAAGEGKMTMEEFASSLSTVLPIASANKVSFSEVSGALATLTQHGTSAREGTQELASTIRSLASPNNVAVQEMQRLGLSSTDVAKGLKDVDKGGRGLSGTFDLLSRTVLGKMGKSGTLLLSSFNKTKQAAKDADQMIKAMPKSIQGLAKSYGAGKISLGDWRKELKTLPPEQANLLGQYATLRNKTNGFSAELKRGGPAAQTYTEAMKKMLGGAIGLNTALQLTGENTDAYNERVKKIRESYNHATKDVEGWDATQKLFNVRLAKAKQAIEVLAIQIGMKLIPVVTRVVDWFSRHQKVALALASVIGGVLALSVVAFAAKMTMSALKPIGTFAKLGKSGFQATRRIVQGFRSAQVAQSAFSGRAGSFGGALRKMWNGSVQGSRAAIRGVGQFGKTVGNLTVKGGKAAWSGLATGIRGAAGAMRTAGSAALTLTRRMAMATATALRSAAAWALQKIRLLAAAIAEKAVAVAQWALNVAMDANPIMLIVIAVAALVAGLIWAYKNVTWFRNMCNAAFRAVGAAVGWVVSYVKTHWKTLLVLLTGPIGIAVAYIVKHWKQITKGFSSAYHGVLSYGRRLLSWIGSLPGKILGPLGGLPGRLGKLASNAWSSFLNYSKAKGLALISWVAGIPSRARKALGNLGSLLSSAGADMIRGLLRGVRSISVSGVMRSIAHSAISSFKSAMGISSPSKVFRSLGLYVGHGLVDGLTASTAKVKTATNRIETLLIQTRNRLKDQRTSSRSAAGRRTNAWVASKLRALAGVERYVKKEDKVMRSLAAKRDAVAAKLKAAQKKLADLQKSWADKQKEVASSIMQGVSVVTESPAEGRAVNSFDIVTQMRAQAAKVTEFARNLKALKSKGVRSDLIDQVAAAGVEGGGDTARALAAASKGQIKEINSLQSSMKSQAKSVGTTVADAMYNSGIQAAKGLVKGLQKQEKSIEKQMVSIAKKMAAAIRKALKIKSPSQVFADIGQYIPQGLAVGIDDAARHAVTAASRLSARVTDAGTISQNALAGSASRLRVPVQRTAGTSAVIHQHLHVNVEGHVLTERKLISVVQEGLAQVGARNPSTYPPYRR
ncbi:phage tail tape measure protein [Streptomyces sp. NBC_00670]|uniref:phage tail tape measure protein n=1 Tax=Streptomyces sp. NBC_00670 TaxID=2975804 RepID=UPI002E368267|nr:phage tail tape measure protein [Streptomyces sp. NBC_00670]